LKNDRLPLRERPGRLSSGRGKDALDSPPRDPHPLARLFLRKIVAIAEAEDLELISRKGDLLNV
jgi:hypothetical protein